jgi:hypothetical protein
MTPAHEAHVNPMKPACRACRMAGLQAIYLHGCKMTGNTVPIWEQVGAIIPIPAGLPGML